MVWWGRPWIRSADYDLVSPLAIGNVQAAAIVAGHLAGVVLADDRAVAMPPPDEVAAATGRCRT